MTEVTAPRPAPTAVIRSAEAAAAHVFREPVLKRVLDLVLSTIGIFLTAPLWPVIALCIRAEDGGPVFYRQERWGRGGKPFRIRKFRTMTVDSDHRFGIIPSREDDPRVTRVGRVLRAMGLDELPQLVSVWTGDMSLVGPRALARGERLSDSDGIPFSYEDLPGFHERLSCRPGLTSLSTLYQPKDTDPRLKFRSDLLYLRRHSLMLDLRLIVLSVWVSLRGGWERRGE